MSLNDLNTLWSSASVYYARGGNTELLWDYDRIAHRMGLDSLLDTIGFIDVVYVIQADRFCQLYGREWGEKFDSQISALMEQHKKDDMFVDFLLGERDSWTE